MVYPISPAELQEDFLRAHVYPDARRTFYWTPSWDPDFYVALARAGFIAIGYDHPTHGPLLLPELQRSYAVLDWERLHVSRQLRRLMRSGRLEEQGVELRVAPSCERVIERLVEYHAPKTWLCPPYRALLAKLPTGGQTHFALHAVELWSRRHDRLVAGELGYTTGSVYTSLSGFCTRPDREWRHFGSLQLVLLAQRLRDDGYAFWNLGHPGMAYKKALGARTLSRRAFLARWRVAVDDAPTRLLGEPAAAPP